MFNLRYGWIGFTAVLVFCPATMGAQPEDPLPAGARLRIGNPRLRHAAPIMSVLFTPDSKQVISGDEDRATVVWDAATGREVRRFEGQAESLGPFALSRDGKMLATTADNSRVLLWNFATGQKIDAFRAEGSLACLALGPDGNLLAWASYQGKITLRDLETGQTRRLEGPSEGVGASLVFAPDGKTLLSSGGGSLLCLWDVDSGKEIRRFNANLKMTADVCCQPAFTPDGARIATGLRDAGGNICDAVVWDRATGKEVLRLPHDLGVSAVAISCDGKTLATAGRPGIVHLWDLATGKKRGELKGLHDGVGGLAFSADGKSLVVGGYWDFTLRIWDLASGKDMHPFNKERRGLEACALSADGKIVVAAGSDRILRVLDASTGRESRAFAQAANRIRHLALTPDGKRLITGDDSGVLRCWETATEKQVWELKEHGNRVEGLAMAPDGGVVAEVSFMKEKAVRSLDMGTGKELWRTPDNGGGETVLFAPDGKSLVFTNGANRMVRVSRDTGKVLAVGKPLSALGGLQAWSPDSAQLLVYDGYFYDGTSLKQGEHLADWTIPLRAAFRPDGKLLALTPRGGEIQVWSGPPWEKTRTLKGHLGGIHTLTFSANGRTLLSGGFDGTMLLWDMGR
jgi:WD40 repeat protein